VNISRTNSLNVAAGAPRLTPQQLQILQQQVRPGSQPSQASQVAAHQLGQSGQILVPSLNGNGNTLNGTHLTASFVNRDSTSSPAHVSPPRKSATPTNVNSPRVTPDQTQLGQVQIGVAPNTGNMIPRPAQAMNYYSSIPGLTPEQQLNVLRFMVGYFPSTSHHIHLIRYSNNTNSSNRMPSRMAPVKHRPRTGSHRRVFCEHIVDISYGAPALRYSSDYIGSPIS
jgi:hypothetical protein